MAAAITCALRKVMQEEGVATKTDTEKFGLTLERHEQNMEAMERRLEALEKRETGLPAPGTPRPTSRPSTGSRNGSTGRTSSGSTRDPNEWKPRLIHIKGFAPYGCETNKKLRKGYAENALQDLYQRLDGDLRSAVYPMPPFAINHGLSMRVVNNQDPWDIARRLDEFIQDIKAWSMYYNKLQNIKDLVGEDKIEGCARSMAIYTVPTYIMVAQARNPNEQPHWIWNEAGCREVGLTAEGRAAAQAEHARPAKRAATVEEHTMRVEGGGLGEL